MNCGLIWMLKLWPPKKIQLPPKYRTTIYLKSQVRDLFSKNTSTQSVACLFGLLLLPRAVFLSGVLFTNAKFSFEFRDLSAITWA